MALAALATSLAMLIDSGAANGLVRSAFEAKTHRPLSFRRLVFHLLTPTPTIVVDDLRIGSPPSITGDDLVRIGHGVFHVQTLPLLIGQAKLTGVELADVDLRMVRRGHGLNNYSFGGGAGLSSALRDVRRMVIARAAVSYVDPQRKLTLKGRLDYDSALGAWPMHIKGGGVDHDEPYSVDAKGAALTNRGPNTPFAFHADLVDGAANASISGATHKPFDFSDFDLAIHGSGPNLADFGYLFGTDVPNTPSFVLSTHVTHHNHVVSFQRIVGQVGGAKVQGDFTSDHSRPRRVLTAHLHAGVLSIKDLAVFFAPPPPHGVTRTQPGVAAKPSGGEKKPFDIAAFQKLDALIDLWVETITGYPAPLNDVRLHLQLRDGRLDLHPLSASLSSGRMNASVQADAGTGGLTVRADAVVRNVPVDKVGLSKTLSGVFDGAAHIAGTGRSQEELLSRAQGALAFRLKDGSIDRSKADALAGDPLKAAWSALTAKSAEVALTCAKGRFILKNGVLTPSDLVIATAEGDAVGQGSINLTNRRIDLMLSAAPSPIARSALDAPIHLTGDLQHPKVSVDIAHAVKRSGLKVVGALLSAPFQRTPNPPPPIACPAPS